MSQKVQILGVKHSGGSVYVGESSSGDPVTTRDAQRIMNWLCDGWRYRFNQHRAHRSKRKLVRDIESDEGLWVEIPLGGISVPPLLSDSAERKITPWLTAMPADILKSPKQIENVEWFASLKRKAKRGGGVPGFKSRKKSPQVFTCWRNGTGNALFRKTGLRSGIVTIAGSTPKVLSRKGESSRWKLQIRVRVSEDIRAYSSVKVNWTARTLVFTSAPDAIKRQSTGSIVGIDRGVVHTLTTSNNEHIDIPKETNAARFKYAALQRKLARQDRTNEARGGRIAKFSSNRRKKIVAELNRLSSREARRRRDWIHQVTTQLVRDHDLIVLEDLRVHRMTKRGRGKRGLNRTILQQSWSGFLSTLQYKAKLAGVEVVLVNPAYTSQACNACGHTARENRESQAVFKCVSCGQEAHADVNAALNILERGLESGQGNGLRHGGMVRLASVSTLVSAPGEVSTPALAGGPLGSPVQPGISSDTL